MYFQGTARIQELLDLIVEKLFTVCLLTGKDAANEFSKGRSTVEKAGQFLLEATPLTLDSLYDGLTQLVEQRLPDRRVTENFPALHSLLQEMVRDGVANLGGALPGSRQVESAPLHVGAGYPGETSAKVVLAGGRIPVSGYDSKKGRVSLRPQIMNAYLEQGGIVVRVEKGMIAASSASTDAELLPKEFPVNALTEGKKVEASVTTEVRKEVPLSQAIGKETPVSNAIEKEAAVSKEVRKEVPLSQAIGKEAPVSNVTEKEAAVSKEVGKKVPASTAAGKEIASTPVEEKVIPAWAHSAQVKANSAPARNRGVVRPSPLTAEAVRLAPVLKHIFPDSSIRWQSSLENCRFWAQVANLLIYIEEAQRNQETLTHLEKEGWRVVVCSREDLYFPRRMERLIQQALRKNKKG